MLEKLPDLVEERNRVFAEMADSDPALMRAWVERHPRNLMAYMGWAVEPHHSDALDDFLMHPRDFWLAPRGAGKSTAALCCATWFALSDPANRAPGIKDLFPGAPRSIDPSCVRVALTGNSAEKAGELHWQAKAMMLDERLQKLYGSLEGTRWKDHTSTTALRTMKLREGTFTALGLGSKVAGGHYDVILVDDWVTEDNARTELQRRRLSDFWKFTVRPTLEPWGRVIGCGTRYHPADWYGEVAKQAQEGMWNLRRTPALEEVGGALRSYWPQAYPVETLLGIQREIGHVAFSTQYQNEVSLLMGDFFESEWLERFFAWDKLPRAVQAGARTIVSLDPAIKAGPKNDYTAFVVVSYAAPNFYVRRVARGQWTEREIISMALRLCHEYRANVFSIEVVGGLEFLANTIQKTRGMPRTLFSRPQQFRGKDKVGRADSVRRFFEQGRVWMEQPTEKNGIQRLIDECMSFPTASDVPGMDDCVDALVWGIINLSRSTGRVVRLARG